MRLTQSKQVIQTTMHINYADDRCGKIESIDIEPIGNERKVVEKALQRFFSAYDNEVALYRAGLMAAGHADANKSHPHYQKYKRLAEKIDIEVTEVPHWNGRVSDDFDVKRVKIEYKDN